jgi:hypothetical protein
MSPGPHVGGFEGARLAAQREQVELDRLPSDPQTGAGTIRDACRAYGAAGSVQSKDRAFAPPSQDARDARVLSAAASGVEMGAHTNEAMRPATP